MLGNSVTVLTSVLAGSFYSFSRNNAALDAVTRALPQKELLDFAQALQSGNAASHIGDAAYVVIFSLALFIFSLTILRRMYVKKI